MQGAEKSAEQNEPLGLNALTDRIKTAADGKDGFGKVIELDLKEDGVIRIDGSGDRVVVSNAVGESDVTIRMSAATLTKLIKGKLSATAAVMTGRISIKGDASLALKLAKFL